VADIAHTWRLSWCADYADWSNWVHDVFDNKEGANRLRRGCLDDTCIEIEELEFDRVTKEAGAEQDSVKRKKLYKQAEKTLTKVEVGYAPIYCNTRVVLVKPRLNLSFHEPGGQHIDTWTIDWKAKMRATGIRWSRWEGGQEAPMIVVCWEG